jgi:retinol dehydrogenase-13
MLTVAFAEKLKSKKITVNVCHPGDVRSTLASNLGYGGHETPEQGAATPAWLATSPEVKGITGKYFEHLKETTCRFGQDNHQVERLYQLCEKY